MPDNMHFSSAATDSTSAPSSMEHSSSPNEFVASPDSGENWSPGPESSSPYPAESLDSSQSASYDYTTARNNPMSSGKQATTISQDLVQQEIESAKQHRNNKKTNSKKKTRLSSGLGSARSSSDQRVQEIRASSLLRCAEACLQQTSFPCLSANYQKVRLLLPSIQSFDPHSVSHSSVPLSSCRSPLLSFCLLLISSSLATTSSSSAVVVLSEGASAATAVIHLPARDAALTAHTSDCH